MPVLVLVTYMALLTHIFKKDKLCFSFHALPLEASRDVSSSCNTYLFVRLRRCNPFSSFHDAVSAFEIISHRIVMN